MIIKEAINVLPIYLLFGRLLWKRLMFFGLIDYLPIIDEVISVLPANPLFG